MIHTIMMADIIKSHLYNQSLLMGEFKETISNVNTRFHKDIKSPLTITLGDEFQGVIKDIETAINIIICIEEALIQNNLPFKIRYIIHQGVIDTEINPNIAYEMLGAGLTKAREILNELKAKQNRIEICTASMYTNQLLNPAFSVYTDIIDKWNLPKDYTIISQFLNNDDYKVVSEITKKTRSQLWKRKKNLNIDSYNAIKKVITLVSKNEICH